MIEWICVCVGHVEEIHSSGQVQIRIPALLLLEEVYVRRVISTCIRVVVILMKIYCPICKEELVSTGDYPPKHLSPSRCKNGHEFMVIIALAQTWIQITSHRRAPVA